MEGKKNLNIGITLLSREVPFHQWLEKGMREEAIARGYEITVFSSDNDSCKQVKQIDYLISEKVDALVISPVDSFTIGDSILLANKSGIPVFTADTANMSRKGKVITHITSDNYQGGKLAGRLLAKSINYKGKVAVLVHPNITSCINREKGFKDSIEEYPDIKLVADIPVPISREKSKEIVVNALKKKRKIDGIFAASDESALGAKLALEELGKIGIVMIVGHDAIPEVKRAIAEGKIFADIRQFPLRIGKESIAAIHNYFNGIKVPPTIYIEVGIWT